jgi:uncharacterized membrane protein
MSSTPISPFKPRLNSVDMLRGLVMVIMVLDHVREYFGSININPTDPSVTTPALFWTRWITHFCAPVFVLLAGTGAYLAGRRGKTTRELAMFLFTRGLWLVFLELTIIRLGMTFDLTYKLVPLTVIWAIGVSMMVLAGLVFLPVAQIAIIGVTIIIGHNALDGFQVKGFSALELLWRVLHQRGPLIATRDHFVLCLYPVLPWIGVMASGYALGSIFDWEASKRQRFLIILGCLLSLGFVILRGSNLYGDPTSWTAQANWTYSLFSFLNCEKYPPSLLYLFMTLGPALIVLAIFEHLTIKPLVTLGRVPLFFYILQWYLIHVLAIIVGKIMGVDVSWMVVNGPFSAPQDYGYSLSFVYVMWGVTMLLLYPACAWFARIKASRRDGWLSYF